MTDSSNTQPVAIPARPGRAPKAPIVNEVPAPVLEMFSALDAKINRLIESQTQVSQAPRHGAPTAIDHAQASLVRQLANNNRAADSKFYLVVVPDAGSPYCSEFADVEGLIDCIRELADTPCHAFPFLGNRLTVTRGPLRFLTTPYGATPLFDPPAADSNTEPSGWMGQLVEEAAVVISEETQD